jgi:hypothetical protein
MMATRFEVNPRIDKTMAMPSESAVVCPARVRATGTPLITEDSLMGRAVAMEARTTDW